jgi:putative aldouronate transport system substrate-binding protein
MKKIKLIVALLLVVCLLMTCVLAACTKPPVTPDDGDKDDPTPVVPPDDGDDQPITPPVDASYKDGTILRMATGYNGEKTGLAYSPDLAGKVLSTTGQITTSGSLKPTWVEMQKRLKIVIDNVYKEQSSAANELKQWLPQMEKVDIVSGDLAGLQAAGAEGNIVNLAEHLDKMPNFKAYLDANPIVRLSITGATSGTQAGAIYISPYFDGVADIERMPLMRIDWIEKLLNGSAAFVGTSSDADGVTKSYNTLTSSAYTPYMDASKNITIDSLNADGTAVVSITKNYAAAKAALDAKYGIVSSGNIVDVMNKYIAKNGGATGEQLVEIFRAYIDAAYGTTYTADTRANLFVGYDAAWDADELVALLRCVTNNPQSLNGTHKVVGWFQRQSTMQRMADMTRLGGLLFGARGMESRSDNLYFDTEGNLVDSRVDAASYAAMGKLNEMYREGLLWEYAGDSATQVNFIRENKGFMEYDYSQTQTLESTRIQAVGGSGLDANAEFSAVMVPVALWEDGTEGGVYMRFTESWRSVKSDGWALSKPGIGNNKDKLNAALALIDYAYTEQGMILLSYGPDEFIEKSTDTSAANNNGKYGYKWFQFNGEWAPVINSKTWTDLQTLSGGNYTDFARQYLGSTLSFVKMQSFEYQCTTEAGRKGAAKLSAAIGLGTIKHVELELQENMWYTSIPSSLPLTQTENTGLSGLEYFAGGDASKFSTSNKGIYNVYIDLIYKGFGGVRGDGLGNHGATAAAIAETAKVEWKGNLFVSTKDAAWDRLLKYYNDNFAK